MSNNEWVTIEGTLARHSDKAFCVNTGSNNIWVPKSLCRNIEATPFIPDSPISFEMQQWQAEEKGLI